MNARSDTVKTAIDRQEISQGYGYFVLSLKRNYSLHRRRNINLSGRGAPSNPLCTIHTWNSFEITVQYENIFSNKFNVSCKLELFKWFYWIICKPCQICIQSVYVTRSRVGIIMFEYFMTSWMKSGGAKTISLKSGGPWPSGPPGSATHGLYVERLHAVWSLTNVLPCYRCHFDWACCRLRNNHYEIISHGAWVGLINFMHIKKNRSKYS